MYINFNCGYYEVKEGDLVLAEFGTFEEAETFVERHDVKK